MLELRIPLLLSLLAGACGGAAGTKPHDMSASRHEQAVREHDASIATAEAACQQKRRGQLTAGPGVPTSAANDPDQPYTPCWRAVDRRVIDAHTRAAAEHRAASEALRAAEARACTALAVEDRDMSPFQHTAEIARVDPLVVEDTTSKVPRRNVVGAIVTFRAVPGMSAEYLQRTVDCHLARNAALGHVIPEMPDCPLVPRGAHARVVSAGDGLAVEIRGDDAEAVREIRARAERLVQRDRTSLP